MVSVATADAFFNGRLNNSVWVAASVEDRASAIQCAIDLIGDRFEFIGVAVGPDLWPRRDGRYFDRALGKYIDLDPAVVPSRFVRAVCLQAEFSLKYQARASTSESFFDKIKVGPIELSSSESPSATSTVEVPELDVVLAPLLREADTSYRWDFR